MRFYASFNASGEPDYAFGSAKLRDAPEGTEVVAGRVGRALRLPDDPKTTATTFGGPGNLDRVRGTIAFWVRPTWHGAGGQEAQKANRFVFSMSGFRVYWAFAHGKMIVMTGTGRTEGGWQWNYAPMAPVTEWQAGQWHHLAVTWDGVKRHKELFLDGKMVGAADSEWMAYRQSGSDFTFGLAWRAPGDYDEFIVWDRVLTAQEIALVFQEPAAAAEKLKALEAPKEPQWPVTVGIHYWTDNLPGAIVRPGDRVEMTVPIVNGSEHPVSLQFAFAALDFHLNETPIMSGNLKLAPSARETLAVSYATWHLGIFKIRIRVRCGDFEGVKDVASFGVVLDPGDNEPEEASFFGGHPEQTRDYVEQAGCAGLKWARCHDMIQSTRWVRVEPEKGNWAFHGDETITRCVQNGMHVLGLFFAPPYWAARVPEGLPPDTDTRGYPPRDMSEYAEYVRRTVEHYKGYIRHWEVWNEPDVGHFWRGTPEEYVELEKLTYQVAKQVDPDCIIIGGGGLHYTLKPWIEAAATAGMLDHCDWFSYHGYMPADDPPEAVLDNINYFKDLLARYGKSDMPIVCTEGGLTDTTFYEGLDFDVLPPERARPAMSWHRGACRLVQVTAIEMAADIRQRFYYYHKAPPVARAYLDYSCLEVNGAPRPKLMAWMAMERQLRGCKFASKVEGEGWCAYLFNGADRSVAVLWADDEVQVRLDTSLPEASYLVDLMGNTRPLPEAGGLTVSDEPLYVVGRGTSADALRDALAQDY